MIRKALKILAYISKPQKLIFIITLANFLWFFSQSRVVVEFGQSSPSFFQQPWYWQPFNISYISLFAACFLLVGRRWSYLAAFFISALEIIDGINRLSNPRGFFFTGLFERVKVILRVEPGDYQELVDWQYLLALLILIIATRYLIMNLFKRIKESVNSYP